jgi:hypothetical protein
MDQRRAQRSRNRHHGECRAKPIDPADTVGQNSLGQEQQKGSGGVTRPEFHGVEILDVGARDRQQPHLDLVEIPEPAQRPGQLPRLRLGGHQNQLGAAIDQPGLVGEQGQQWRDPFRARLDRHDQRDLRPAPSVAARGGRRVDPRQPPTREQRPRRRPEMQLHEALEIRIVRLQPRHEVAKHRERVLHRVHGEREEKAIAVVEHELQVQPLVGRRRPFPRHQDDEAVQMIARGEPAREQRMIGEALADIRPMPPDPSLVQAGVEAPIALEQHAGDARRRV